MCKQTLLPLIIDLQRTQEEQRWSKDYFFLHMLYWFARSTWCNKPYEGEFWSSVMVHTEKVARLWWRYAHCNISKRLHLQPPTLKDCGC